MSRRAVESISVIYVGEDSEVANEVAKAITAQDDRFVVDAVERPDEALERLESTHIDCVVSDHGEGGIDGIELLDSVRDEYPYVPFVLFATAGSERVASDAISAGVTDYLRNDGSTDRYAKLAERVESAIDRTREFRTEQAFVTQALETLGELFYVAEPDGTMHRWSDGLSEETGYDDEAIADMRVTEFFPEDERERITDAIEAMMETGEPGERTIESELLTADGRRIPYEFTGGQLFDSEGEPVGIVGTGRNVTGRRDQERTLKELHSFAIDLLKCETPEEVCDRTIQAAETVLEFDLSVINLESDGMLPIVSISEEVPPDGATTMSIDEGLVGKSYRSGESFRVDDLRTHPEANPQGPYRSALSVPVSDYGVFQTVAKEPNAFDDTDLEMAELLVNHTANTLRRLDRERELERKNDRLEEFASIVSHDLRNPLSVASGRVELARETFDSEDLDATVKAHKRMQRLIEDLLKLAREGDAATELTRVDVADTAEECWENVVTDEATLVVDVERSIRADRGRFKQLLENLFRNAVEHGGSNVSVSVGELPDGDGFYVEDDGAGVPEGDREHIFESGFTTSDEGTGFGLRIVERIVDAHEWEIRVTERDEGGARFEITGVTFVQ